MSVLQKLPQHLQMDSGIPHNPLLAHRLTARLKLGLHQTDYLSVRL